MKLSEELKWRGMTNQTTLQDVTRLNDEQITFYWGVDPSAASMTIGNLAAAMMVKHFMNAGHKAVLLIGGATGMIGDPDGKSKERELIDDRQIESNKKSLVAQYKRIFEGQDFKIVDNYDWFKDMNYLDFLRKVGKHVPLRQMVGRDFVQSRMGDGGSGISYAEFSYVLIQAYDFVYLNQHHKVSLQLCGSDQWGNSIAGVDLIRRMRGNEAHVWSTPLVLNSATGKKFGKTEDGAIWLDPDNTSPFKFYQFWLNLDDEGVEEYLKIYTMLSQDKIYSIIDDFKANPSDRLAQHTLAREVTKLIHGNNELENVERATRVLFGSTAFSELNEAQKEMLRAEFSETIVTDDLYAMLVEVGLASSKSEARNFHKSGAISVNGSKVLPDQSIEWYNGVNLLKRGKNNFAIALKK